MVRKFEGKKPFLNELVATTALLVAGLFFCIDVPDDVVWKAIDTVTGSFRHLGKALSFGLIFESIAWEINACIEVSQRMVAQIVCNLSNLICVSRL